MPASKNLQLICPIDQLLLSIENKCYVCENGHSFDIARQGYVNLLPVQHKRSMQPGDSKEMVNARKLFLDSGVYEQVANTIYTVLQRSTENKKLLNVLDAGCGEGYYLDYIVNKFTNENKNSNGTYIGLDISKHAVIAAAKRNKEITWVVGTNRAPPIDANSIDVILCVFGFQSYQGFNKVLKPDGVIILVEPAKEHLKELRDVIYTEVKQTEPTDISEAEQDGFVLADTQYIKFNTDVINAELLQHLLLMTPHFFRANQAARDRVAELDSLSVTVDMIVRVLKKN